MPDTFVNPNLVFVRPIHGVDIIVAWLHNGKNRSACIHFSPLRTECSFYRIYQTKTATGMQYLLKLTSHRSTQSPCTNNSNGITLSFRCFVSRSEPIRICRDPLSLFQIESQSSMKLTIATEYQLDHRSLRCAKYILINPFATSIDTYTRIIGYTCVYAAVKYRHTYVRVLLSINHRALVNLEHKFPGNRFLIKCSKRHNSVFLMAHTVTFFL